MRANAADLVGEGFYVAAMVSLLCRFFGWILQGQGDAFYYLAQAFNGVALSACLVAFALLPAWAILYFLRKD